MAKIPECERCHYYAFSPYLVCGVNPEGPEGDTCPDFEPPSAEPNEQAREPVAGGYYVGEWIPQPPRLTTEEQQYLLDRHPLFTGRCPNCAMPIRQTEPSWVHWDCGVCGWMDDSI